MLCVAKQIPNRLLQRPLSLARSSLLNERNPYHYKSNNREQAFRAVFGIWEHVSPRDRRSEHLFGVRDLVSPRVGFTARHGMPGFQIKRNLQDVGFLREVFPIFECITKHSNQVLSVRVYLPFLLSLMAGHQ